MPKMPPIRSKDTKMAPKMAPAKTAWDAFKTAEDGFQEAPKTAQELPIRLKQALRGFQNHSKRLEEASKTP